MRKNKTFVVMRLSAKSSTTSSWTSWVADCEFSCFSDKFLHELVVDRLVDINTLGAEANLALIREATPGTSSCCGVNICVLEIFNPCGESDQLIVHLNVAKNG